MKLTDDIRVDLEKNHIGEYAAAIHQLAFPDPARKLNPDQVRELAAAFRDQGCRNLDVGHIIPALQGRSTVKERRVDIPDGEKLVCLHGLHRIAAAKLLPEHNRPLTWVVALFSDNLGPAARKHLRDGHVYFRPYSDGYIFRQVCLASDQTSTDYWLSQLLSKTKRRDLKLLARRTALFAALRKLVDIEAFWYCLHIGSFEYLLQNYFEEEMINYLVKVDQEWDKLLLGPERRRQLAGLVDESTVKRIQLMAPKVSQADWWYLQSVMNTGELFPNITETETRQTICIALLDSNRIITLETFLQDCVYIRECSRVMRALVPSRKISNRLNFYEHYRQAEKGYLQTGENSFEEVESSFDSSYDQLNLYVMRHLPELVPCRLKGKQMDVMDSTVLEPRPLIWIYLARLAQRVNFESCEITTHLAVDLKAHVTKFLPILYPPTIYSIGKDDFTSIVGDLGEPPHLDPPKTPPFVTSAPELPMHLRSGLPDSSTQNGDCLSLFRDNVVRAIKTDHKPDRYITPFYVRCHIFYCFFGARELDLRWKGKVEMPLIKSEDSSAGDDVIMVDVMSKSFKVKEETGEKTSERRQTRSMSPKESGSLRRRSRSPITKGTSVRARRAMSPARPPVFGKPEEVIINSHSGDCKVALAKSKVLEVVNEYTSDTKMMVGGCGYVTRDQLWKALLSENATDPKTIFIEGIAEL